MSSEKKNLLNQYYRKHRDRLNFVLLRISFFYLFVSIAWNSSFLLLQLKFSRANIYILFLCLVIGLLLSIFRKKANVSTMTMQHIILSYEVFVITCLYFASGFKESWGYFLLVPLIAGLYGERLILFIYSLIGLTVMFVVSLLYPMLPKTFDTIDFSNRILLYIIVATIGYLLLKQLNRLYINQANTIIKAMEQTIEQVVKSFIVAIEAKDYYTFGHSDRVSQYAIQLAMCLHEFQDEKKLHTLQLTGMLHDIGKINIPENVLTKPSGLTNDEYELIKTHPVVGGKMVEKISGLGALKPGVLYHHERWDGEGYPSGIKGSAIPLEARILAVADAFDAMTSDRAYRSALGADEAFARLKDGEGTQFDPFLIQILDEYKDAWVKIHSNSKESMEEFENITDLL